MRVLHLTLKKKWFDMIASGEKKEEYREVKEYWEKRLMHRFFDPVYTHVQFRNGYAKNSPTILLEIDGNINISKGKQEWGAEEGKQYFVIKLGGIITPSGANSVTNTD